MRRIEASEFEARCLAILDELAATGEEITITKGGRAVARLTPPVRVRETYPQERLRGTVIIRGDIVGPVVAEKLLKPKERPSGTSPDANSGE